MLGALNRSCSKASGFYAYNCWIDKHRCTEALNIFDVVICCEELLN
jgi:hypothetical protein